MQRIELAKLHLLMVSITLPPINPVETPLQRRIKKQANGIVIDELPDSYKTNTSEESTILDFAENFRKQYSSFNPQRAELILVPTNECGVGVIHL